MAETKTAIKWLNEKDNEEWVWAAEYLSSRSTYSERGELGLLISGDFTVLVKTIKNLETTAEGVKLVARLRNAIRQRRYRSSKGGRTTCSFTLPLNTKTALKRLAKSLGTTETATIESLIEGASQSAQDQKREKRREAFVAKVMRNSSTLAQELNGVRIEETKKHLRLCLKRLACWEVHLKVKDELPELSLEEETAANALAEKRMRDIQAAIGASVAKHKMMSPRSLS